MKTLPSTLAAAAAIVVGAMAVVSFTVFAPTPEDPVYGRVVVTSSAPAETGVVEYEYLGEPLPEKIVPDEVVEKRTESSYTRKLGVENAGTAQERTAYQATIYEKEVYVQAGGKWYLRETATTTEAALLDAKPLYRVAKALSTAVAHAASYSGFSEAGDGNYRASAIGNVDDGSVGFGNCLAGLTANGSDGVSTQLGGATGLIQVSETTGGFGSCDIRRGYFVFNTASVPSGSNVSAASFQMYVTAKTNGSNDGLDVLDLVDPNTSVWTSWGTAAGANSIDIGSVTTSAYNTFTLNATGFGFLVLGGNTDIGIREGHDTGGSAPAATNSVTFSTSEQTGTSQDPTLSITYTLATRAFWQFQDF